MKIEIENHPSEERGAMFQSELIITNDTNYPVTLQTITPTVSNDITLQHTTIDLTEEKIGLHRSTCDKLEELINDHMVETFSEIQKPYIMKMIDFMEKSISFKKSLSTASMFISSIIIKKNEEKYFDSLSKKISMTKYWINHSPYAIRVNDADDASTGLKLANIEAESNLHSIAMRHVEILNKLENDGVNIRYDQGMQTLHPGGVIIRKYSVTLKRSLISRNGGTFGFRCDFRTNNNHMISVEKTEHISVSAEPLALSAISAISAILGYAINRNSSRDIQDETTPPINDWMSADTITEMVQLIFEDIANADNFGPAFIAIVIFNVYGRFNIVQLGEQPVSWRSALLIGLVVGLGYPNLVNALSSLLNVN